MSDAIVAGWPCAAGRIEPLTVTMVGDLKYGRTVHSLAQLLAMYDVRLHYVAPAALQMPQYVVDKVAAAGVEQSPTDNLSSVLGQTDVLYVARAASECVACHTSMLATCF